MARIIVSAGHTKTDPGSSFGDLKEADLTRAIAKKIIPHLRGSGAITLSVPPDLDLSKRIEWINGTGYASKYNDIAIEIHINDGGKTGYEFWYGGQEDDKSQKLAESIMSTLNEDTGLPNQGIHSHKKHEYGSLAFIEQTNTVSVMLECLYIDNDEDIKRLKDESFVDKMAKSIAKGVLKYLNIEYKPISDNATPNTSSESKITTAATNSVQNLNQNQPYSPARKHMSKAEREEMIITMYQRILGRNPNQNDMNYFLNIGIDEDGLLKRMVNSQEHLDILQAAQQYFLMRSKFETQSYDITRLQVESRDKDIMLHNYKQLLQQKNQHISKLNAQLQQYSGKPQSPGKSNAQPKKQYQGSLSDRIFHFFSKILN